MIHFGSRLILHLEYEKWRRQQVPIALPNINTVITFLSSKDLIDDELINAWCDRIERDEYWPRNNVNTGAVSRSWQPVPT